MSKKSKKTPEKDRRMKVLWSSNAPWAHSGYSTQTRDLLYRFLDDGWKFAASCFYGLEGGFVNVNGLPCYPKMGQQFGGDAMYWHQKEFGADTVITFQDIWPVEFDMLNKLKNWIAYVPIDHDPVPTPVFERLKHAYRIVTFSKFGQDALKRGGLTSTLILEGTDTNVFKPMDQKEQRKMFGIPEDVFMFGMVAANKDNPPRKSFQHCMDAFKRLRDNHPKEKFGIFFHTLLQQAGGFDIQQYAQYLGMNDNIYFPPPYQMMFKSPHQIISRVMNLFDVFLNPSVNEGFGLPIIESQACGKPVIVNSTTSMPELVIPGKTGFVCDHGFKRWTLIHGYVAEPDLDSLYDKMEEAYRLVKENKEQVSKDCRKHILDNYDIDKRVEEEWIPFLEMVQKEVVVG